MTRVVVIGNAGGGKSTLCRALSRSKNINHWPIDQIQWKPNWVQAPDHEVQARVDAIIEQNKWIIDGFGPWESIQDRMEACDTIVFVDLPVWVHFWWATKRQVKSVFVGRSDGPEGCPMLPVTFKLYKMIWNIHRNIRPRLLAEIAKYDGLKRVIHIESRAELSAYLQELRASPTAYRTA